MSRGLFLPSANAEGQSSVASVFIGFHRQVSLLLGTLMGLIINIGFPPGAIGADPPAKQAQVPNPWPALIQQAEELGLPTTFLKHIDPNFVTVVFEDLRTYAAEYHPPEHRMILNMRLSFNQAGGSLADLGRMTHHDLGLLYHELFHAYLDFIYSAPDPKALPPEAQQLLSFANEQLTCHFRFVRINPIRQRKLATELRFLSKEDAWEVLNETWAVFVGWSIWTKLELFQENLNTAQWSPDLLTEWSNRLQQANQTGELLGYYEPDDPEERRVARKRFIAPSNGLTPKGVELLLAGIIEEPPELIEASTSIIEQTLASTEPPPSCE
jgi:hypothetical protein